MRRHVRIKAEEFSADNQIRLFRENGMGVFKKSKVRLSRPSRGWRRLSFSSASPDFELTSPFTVLAELARDLHQREEVVWSPQHNNS